MFKKTLIAAFFTISASAFAQSTATDCANFAKAAAIRAYKASVGTVQGSEGIQYEIKEKLVAKLPFHNYVISITDNNEDGDTWMVDYFVMTKKVSGKCQVLKVKEQETAALKISTYSDFDSDEFEAPVDIDVTVDFVQNSGKYVDFRVFTDEDTYPSICYKGSLDEAAKIVESILDVSTGDSFILSSKISFSAGKIIHQGSYTEGSGDYDFPLNFEIKKCL